ncbi:MAG TPA: YdeI/OmpD-associated family protein [Rubellimicrobium sp.]|nr:YdeI/OmpD-associated family protein [Rubellimicrobium sp.]
MGASLLPACGLPYRDPRRGPQRRPAGLFPRGPADGPGGHLGAARAQHPPSGHDRLPRRRGRAKQEAGDRRHPARGDGLRRAGPGAAAGGGLAQPARRGDRGAGRRPELAEALHGLTPGRQRSYFIALGSAKTSVTRAARVVTFRDRIMAGKGAQER